MFKKYTLFILIVVMLASHSAVAVERIDSESSSYIFHLYYDNGQLFADRDFEFKYDVIPEKFISENYTTRFPFRGEIINFKNQVSSEFLFDPKRGDIKFIKGKISVKAPYASDGQKAVFYDSQEHQLLNIFVSDSSFCNDDGVCNSDKGEDLNTCSNDCNLPASPMVPPSGSVSSSGTGVLKALLYSIIGAVIIGGWFGWKWWKRRKELAPIESPMISSPSNNSQNIIN